MSTRRRGLWRAAGRWYGRGSVEASRQPVGPVEVGPLEPGEAAAAVGVLARGMRDNPLHVAVFGPDPDRRVRLLTRIFTPLLEAAQPGAPLCARLDRELVGVTGVAPPGTCQPSFVQQVRFLPALVACGPRTAARAGRWLRAWSDRDPDEPHVHLGPLAVDTHLQGRGVGSKLLAEHCLRLDAAGQTGYLETDRPENVPLYERNGYEVVDEARVLDVPNWFMRRSAR